MAEIFVPARTCERSNSAQQRNILLLPSIPGADLPGNLNNPPNYELLSLRKCLVFEEKIPHIKRLSDSILLRIYGTKF